MEAKTLLQTLETPAGALEKTRVALGQFVNVARGASNAMRGGSVSGNLIVQVYENLVRLRAHFAKLEASPNLRKLFRDEFGREGAILLSAADSVKAGVDSLIQLVSSNFPGDGAWVKFEKDGVRTRSYTTSETIELANALDTLVSEIV